ncbi:UDP-N-acetylmuramoyl-tripeptide--D-alanyl-D-alanine ligase [Maribacter sp. CXY002]|uniref:UDP-N-acetylmuramoyl-tripeptide--D-alanyl-D- alanine ligase n=1 Tax=Maribacter luteocoastalis TaxID=3407671 RepID=UPI003B681FA0
MTIEELHGIFLKNPYICTDTRKINKGDIFFALKGDHFNGNEYAQTALSKGASYVIIDDEKYVINERTIVVDNALETLQKLSNYHRRHSKVKVIALTGSNGKTTTKELINAVLAKKYNTIATIGNLNNHIGVPLTLLSIKDDTDIAVVEMGANHQKEIEFLSNLAEPDFGYITNFGKAHLEGFGGIEGVIKGKSELYDYLIAHNKFIFLNADDPIQKEKLATYIKKIGFSEQDHNHFNIKFLGTNPTIALEFEKSIVQTNLIGKYNFTNCCAAIVMGKYFNVDKNQIIMAIEAYVPDNNRSQIIEKNGHKIILDAYNANPTSTREALLSFNQLKAHNKLVFLGDMFELGEHAQKEHQEIANLVLELGLTTFLVGENYSKINCQLETFKSFNELKEFLSDIEFPNSTILIKGSRGMAMERLLDCL